MPPLLKALPQVKELKYLDEARDSPTDQRSWWKKSWVKKQSAWFIVWSTFQVSPVVMRFISPQKEWNPGYRWVSSLSPAAIFKSTWGTSRYYQSRENTQPRPVSCGSAWRPLTRGTDLLTLDSVRIWIWSFLKKALTCHFKIRLKTECITFTICSFFSRFTLLLGLTSRRRNERQQAVNKTFS